MILRFKLLALILAILGSCSRNKMHECVCPSELVPVYQMELGTNDDISFAHYIMIDEYSDNCFEDIPFVKLAKDYCDTVSFNTPISSIRFIEPGTPNDVAEDLNQGYSDKIDEISILDLAFASNYVSRDSLGFYSVTFYKNDTPHKLHLW